MYDAILNKVNPETDVMLSGKARSATAVGRS